MQHLRENSLKGGSLRAALIAHRGESHDAPENTLPAYRMAVERGFGFECDIYLSKDRRLFTFHDGDLKRTTAGANTNRCTDASWDGEISEVNVGGWGKWKGSRFDPTRPALLSEVLDLARDGRWIYVEVKGYDPSVVPYIRTEFARAKKATPRNVLFIAFSEGVCAELKRQMPEYHVYWLTGCTRKGRDGRQIVHTPDEIIAVLRKIRADGVDIHFDPKVVDAAYVKSFRDAGFSFHVWTVDDPKLARKAFAAGVETLTTNRAKFIEDSLADGGTPSPSARCLARLQALGDAQSSAWAWTYPWFRHDAPSGDCRNAWRDSDGGWRPKPLDETVLVTPTGRAEAKLEHQFDLRPKYYYLDFHYATGTLRPLSYYAANRASMTAVVRKAWRERGAVPVFSWHMDHPCATNGFPQAAYRFTCSDHKDIVGAIVRDERDGNFAPRAWFEARLAEIAGFLNGLTDEKGGKIPVILRYAHEMDGSWFWWGKGHCAARDFISLARMEADFLRARCGAGQILFAYTPDRWWQELGQEGASGYLQWYPGENYVDVVGYDDYAIGTGKTPAERAKNFDNALRKLRILSEFAHARGKTVILSESGAPDSGFFYEDISRLVASEGVRVAFFNTWIGPWTWPRTEAGMRDLKRFARTRTLEKL